jgi:hypothetical protein
MSDALIRLTDLRVEIGNAFLTRHAGDDIGATQAVEHLVGLLRARAKALVTAVGHHEQIERFVLSGLP